MLNGLRGGICSCLALLLLTLWATGCSRTEPQADSKEAGTKSSNSETAAIPPVADVPGDSLVQVLETLPKDQWPQHDKDVARFEQADKWLKANMPGKRVSVTSSLPQLSIIPPSKAGEKFRIGFRNGRNSDEQIFEVNRGKGDDSQVKPGLLIWGRHLPVELRKPDEVDEAKKSGLNLTVDKPELDRLRALETKPGGKDARLTFTIDNISVGPTFVSILVKDLVLEKAAP